MSKIDELREILKSKKKELKEETEAVEDVVENVLEEVVEEGNYHIVHDIIQDPSTKSRKYLMVEIKYDIDTGECILGKVMNFTDKTIGYSVVSRKYHAKYLYDKCKGERNENK